MRLLIAGLALFLGIHALPMIPSLRAALSGALGRVALQGRVLAASPRSDSC